MPMSQKIPPIVQGMSQQAATLRNPAAGDLQLNAISDPIRGMGKRPGTEHVSILQGVTNRAEGFVHYIERDGEETYIFTFDGTLPKVHDLTGLNYPVIATDLTALAYLASSNPRRDLDALTVSDRTYLTNTDETVSLSDTLTDALVEEAVVWIRGGAYDTSYRVTLDGNEIIYTTHRSTQDTGATGITETTIKTDWIASKLANGSTAGENSDSASAPSPSGSGLAGVSGFTITRYDNYIHIKKTDESSFTISATDGVGDTHIEVAHVTVPAFSDLPPSAQHDMVIKVKGLEESDNDDYWLKFVAKDGSGFGEGVWEETPAPETQSTFDGESLPRFLDRKQDDSSGTATGVPYQIYFELGMPGWKSRPAGDDDTNTAPSFVGRSIDTAFLLAGRLAFASGPNVIASRVNDFDQFWKTSAISLTDDDRIDATISTAKAISIKQVVPQTQEVLLIGDTAQVSIPTDEIITPANFRFSPATTSRVDVTARPAVSNRSMFLPFRSTEYSGIREHSTTGIQGLKDSTTITLATPELLLGSVIRMDVADEINTLYTQTDGNLKRIYVYRWQDNGPQRVMSSMSYWSFAGAVLGLKVIQGYLWILVDRPDGVCLERVALDPMATQPGQTLPFRLDRFSVLTAPPTNPADPGDPPDGDDGGPDTPGGGVIVFGGGEVPFDRETAPAAVGPITRPVNATVELSIPYEATSSMQVVNAVTGVEVPYTTVPGDRTRLTVDAMNASSALVIGLPFTHIFDFSETYPFVSSATGLTALTGGRLQLIRFHVDYFESGPFNLTPMYITGAPGAATVAAHLHDLGDLLTTVSLRSGTAEVPIYDRSDNVRVRISSDSFWPCWITSAEWEGEYFKGTQSI